jgi:hypothetical protein
MTISIEKGHNGVEPVVVVRFGVKCRTFTVAKWDELRMEVERCLASANN